MLNVTRTGIKNDHHQTAGQTNARLGIRARRDPEAWNHLRARWRHQAQHDRDGIKKRAHFGEYRSSEVTSPFFLVGVSGFHIAPGESWQCERHTCLDLVIIESINMCCCFFICTRCRSCAYYVSTGVFQKVTDFVHASTSHALTVASQFSR